MADLTVEPLSTFETPPDVKELAVMTIIALAVAGVLAGISALFPCNADQLLAFIDMM